MKRFFGTGLLRNTAALLTASMLFAACKKDDTNYVRTPVAGVMAFNLATDKNAVLFTLSGNQLGNNSLGYTNFTGTYLPVYVGSREVKSIDYSTGTTLATTTADFADSMYYSTFVVGANGQYRNVIVKDSLATLTAADGKAWVRFINAIPDSTAVPVITVGAANDSSSSTYAPFATVSAFRQVNAGEVPTAISNGGTITASRNISLQQNKVYTVLFIGLPNQTDSTKAVQIRYIQNGNIAP